METSTKWILGIGLLTVATITTVAIIKHNKKNDEPKGKGELTLESKQGNKIVFTKK